MRSLVVIFIGTLVAVFNISSAFAYQYRYTAGFNVGKATLTSGDSAKFPLQNSYGFNFGYTLADHWRLDIDYSWYNLSNDTSATSSFTFHRAELDATRKWQAKRLGFLLERRLFTVARRLHLGLGLGGGLLVWKVVDPAADSTIDVKGIHNETTDFAAPEIFLSVGSSLKADLSERWTLGWQVRGDYLTGAGAEFADEVLSGRDRWLFNSGLVLTFSFGSTFKKVGWRSERVWSTLEKKRRTPLTQLDSDNDGVADESDRCPNTPAGAVVDDHGCSLDSDHDGVADGLDHCPATDRQARGKVDIFGCPVDSDFDGVPDYLDGCPHNRVGAIVDDNGCPLDTDADGVPDGLDDCPNTLYGVDVDRNGCIDLSMLSKPMVLNIDYPPGSFEIDPRNRERLKKLARLLNFVPAIKLDINGYTDNIGTAAANRKLSEKRARRVRDYLVTLGVAPDRMKVFGKGETNFIASNQTARGRAKNRRIEIIFYK
jgi:outer membrane protein OmpA-like peptidoglycan-associated protein